MKFKPEDFNSLLTGAFPAQMDIKSVAAILANAKLQEWLDKAPRAAKCVGLVSGWDAYELHENWAFTPSVYSHEAKLVCIKEVK